MMQNQTVSGCLYVFFSFLFFQLLLRGMKESQRSLAVVAETVLMEEMTTRSLGSIKQL